MSLQHIFKNSSVSGKEPTASQLANGELSINYHADGPFLCCKDTAGVVRRITGVWVAATPPGTPTSGELWLDISLNPTQLKIYKDGVDGWVFAGNVVSASTSTAGVVELSTDAETQAGGSTVVAVTPASLQSKLSDSTSTSSSTTIASSSAVKAAYDLAATGISTSGGTITGTLEIGTTGSLTFEGSSADAYETTLGVVDPTGDRSILLPDTSGTVITTGDTGTVTSTMLTGAIADSKLSTISSADKVSLSALNIDGGTDIGAALADADLIIVDDGGNGTNRKAAVTRLTDYTFAKLSGDISATSAGVTTIKTDLALSGSPTAQTQAAGTNNTTLATTAFVMAAADAARQGLTVKQACRAATTANITLSGTQTIDGVAVVAGDRVLVKSQSTAAENGIYICAASGWTRATDFDAGADLLDGAFTFIEEGTANADSGWVLTTNGPITVGVTSLAFVQFSGAGQITAGSGLSKNANTLSVASGGITSDMLADGTIVNADISGSAAIADTKLATITTAGKVSGSAITSGAIATSGNVGITNVFPALSLTESDGTATHSQSVLVKSADQFQIQTRSSAGVFVSTDYSILANASGATDHIWRIANTEQIRLDSGGRLLKGITTVFNVAGSTPGVQIASLTTGSGAHLNVGRFSNDTGASVFSLAKSRSGTAGIVGSAVISGDTLGNISFAGDDGTDLNTTGATIAARVSGTVSSDVIPTALAFQTMNTSGTLADRLYIQPNGNVSIGSTGSSSVNLEVDKTITGAPTAYGVVVDGTVQSDVTTTAVGFATSLDTANTSFTLTNLIHFNTIQPAFGASSAVTTQYGFNAASSLTGATNNYGFYGQLSSASGRWNFYASGSAPNFFVGDVRTNSVFTDRTASANSNVTATAAASSLLDGIRTGTPTADINLQVPTGANMEAAFQDLQINHAFEWSVINLATAASGFDITVTNNTTHTLVGNMKVTGETSGRFKTRKTATDTFITYRIA